MTELRLQGIIIERALNQRDMAMMLKVNQPAVSKLQQGSDVYVSSLRSCIKAVGGKLNIFAKFPGGEVAITNFSGVEGANNAL